MSCIPDTEGFYAILYEGLEHPQMLVFARGPGTNPLRLLRDDQYNTACINIKFENIRVLCVVIYGHILMW